MTRSRAKAAALSEMGVRGIAVDALDAGAVAAAVAAAAPEVVIHELTALPKNLDIRRFDRDFAMTNELRRKGTDHLLAAARAAGARRFVAQSYAGWPYAREGSAVKTEDDPLQRRPPRQGRKTLAAIRYLENAVLSARDLGGTILRYGALYGPGTSIAADGAVSEALRRRAVPVVGSGAGIWSFLHVDDAAGATALASEGGAAGLYNIVDDEPAPVRDWLPALAEALGAPPPRHLPGWLGRLLIGGNGMALMTDVRGASNAKAKAKLGWSPYWASWRRGFREGLGA